MREDPTAKQSRRQNGIEWISIGIRLALLLAVFAAIASLEGLWTPPSFR